MDLMKRLSKAKTSLILESPFIGSVALNMPMTLSTSVPTAATNGKRVLYNPDFIEPLTDEELKFLVAHECLHPMLEHNYRRGARDPKKWNKAADYVINQLLTDEGIGKFIEGGCLDQTIYNNGGGTSDGIYNLLPDDGGDGGDGGDPGGTGNDLEDGEGDQAEQAQQAAEWKIKVAQAAQAAKMMGKLSANMERLVGEILQPKVDWREVLQRFVQKAKNDQRSFARPNRRFLSQGLYLPTVSGEVLGELVFAVDMSGSISQKECDQFAAECRTVFEDGRPEKLHLIFFSHEVCAHDTIDRDGDFVFNARGGGGTAFSPVFRHIEEQGITPAAIVFLTDLCCSDFGDAPDYPVLWVSTEEGSAPFGEVVMMG
jgi:predicted metal-dependent peptidase